MGKNLTKVDLTFEFCDGGSCKKAQSEQAIREARACIRNNDLWDKTHTIKTRCNGRCEDAPTWVVHPGNYWYKNLTPEKAIKIITSHTENNTPVDEFLLFKNEWDQMKSDKEKIIPPVAFKQKQNIDFGNHLVARASASDQYIYPLFKFLFEQDHAFNVCLNDNKYKIDKKHTVDYTDTVDIEVSGSVLNFKFAIGGVTKTDDGAIQDRKVGVSEVIWLQENTIFDKAIRFKNRKGKELITFWFNKNDTVVWNYILKIYLGMDPEKPRINIENN